MILLLLLGAILGAFSVIFVLQNIVPITVTFLVWQISGSLAVILFFTMLSGMAIALLLILPGLIRDEYRYRMLRKEKEHVDIELATTKSYINGIPVNTAGSAIL